MMFVVVFFSFLYFFSSLCFRRFHALSAINKSVGFIHLPSSRGPQAGRKKLIKRGGGEGKKLLCATLARCSKIVHGLLTHTDRALHKSRRSAGGAVGDATGRCFFPPAVPPSLPSPSQVLSPASSCSLAFTSVSRPRLVFHRIHPTAMPSFRAAAQSQLRESRPRGLRAATSGRLRVPSL